MLELHSGKLPLAPNLRLWFDVVLLRKGDSRDSEMAVAAGGQSKESHTQNFFPAGQQHPGGEGWECEAERSRSGSKA